MYSQRDTDLRKVKDGVKMEPIGHLLRGRRQLIGSLGEMPSSRIDGSSGYWHCNWHRVTF